MYINTWHVHTNAVVYFRCTMFYLKMLIELELEILQHFENSEETACLCERQVFALLFHSFSCILYLYVNYCVQCCIDSL